MIGTAPEARGWTQAAAISLVLHGAAAGWLIYQPSLPMFDPADLPPLVEITAVTAPQMTVDPVPAPVLTTVPAPEIAATPIPQIITPDPIAAQQTEPPVSAALPDQPAELRPEASVLIPLVEDPSLILPAGPQAGLQPVPPDDRPPDDRPPDPSAAAGDTPLPTQSVPEAGEPADPRLAALVERVRARLAEPCLLALPVQQAEGAVQLSVLSDSDRNISALMDDLTRGIEGDIGRRAALLAPAQCAAVGFARRDTTYPLFPLGLHVQTPSLPSGEVLRGQITGAAGYYTTLLLVDDNGVVHDLRRYLLSSARSVGFELPVARRGNLRDTQQLLIAIATASRPQAVATHAGETARDFFDALAAEVGDNVLIGVTSVELR